MTHNLLAVENMLAGTAGVSVALPSHLTTRNPNRSSKVQSDNPSSTDSPQPAQFDSVLANSQLQSSGPPAEQSPERVKTPSGLLSEDDASPISQKTQDKKELENQGKDSLIYQIIAPLQVVLPDTSATANVTSEPSGIPSKLPALLSGSDEGPAVSQTAKGDDVTKMIPPTPVVAPAASLLRSKTAGGQTAPGAVNCGVSPNQLASDGEKGVNNDGGKGPSPNGTPLTQTDSSITKVAIEQTSASVSQRTDVETGGNKTTMPGKGTDGQQMGEQDPSQIVQSQSTELQEQVAPNKQDDNKTDSRKIRTATTSIDDGTKKITGNLLADSAAHKQKSPEIQLSDSKQQDPNKSALQSKSSFLDVVSAGDTQNFAAKELSYSPEIAKTANGNNSDNISGSIKDQILGSIRSSLSNGEREINIRLNPPELGKVVIKFQEQNAQITGLLEVTETQTRYELEQALPQLIRDLQDSGIEIKRLVVVLAEQTGQQSSADHSTPDSWFHQDRFSESDALGSDKSAHSWLTYGGGPADIFHAIQITDGSIDILM